VLHLKLSCNYGATLRKKRKLINQSGSKLFFLETESSFLSLAMKMMMMKKKKKKKKKKNYYNLILQIHQNAKLT
jgi:hypothetical protein